MKINNLEFLLFFVYIVHMYALFAQHLRSIIPGIITRLDNNI